MGQSERPVRREYPHASSQLDRRWSSQNAATEQLTMLQRRVLTAVTCIAAVNAFVAPSRSVARPSSSHAQPTAPAAMRQQTYACSARIKGLRARLKHIYRDAIDATTTRQPDARLTRQRPHRQLNMVIPGDSAARVWVEIKQLGYLARNIC